MNHVGDLRKSLFDLTGRVVVITGAAGLLGRQHVEVVAAFGGHPVILDLDGEAATTLAATTNVAHTANAIGLSVDITDEVAVKRACVATLEHYGRIDALVNNAANNPKVEDGLDARATRLEHFSLDTWNADVAVGLTGAFLCAKHFGQAIFETSEGGSIINISSDLGLIAPDQRLYAKAGVADADQPVKPVTYSVTKAGIIGLTRYLSTYWTRDGNVVVRCNVICPGGVENRQSEGFIHDVSSRIPMGRMAQENEIQGALAYLLSPSAAYVNGAVLVVDGGRAGW